MKGALAILLLSLGIGSASASMPRRSSVVKQLAASAARLALTDRPVARAEVLAPVVQLLADESASSARSEDRMADAISYAILALELAERGLASQLLEESGDDSSDDLALDRAAASALRALDVAQSLLDTLTDNQRVRLQLGLDRAEPRVRKAAKSVEDRLTRHGVKRRESPLEGKKVGPDEDNPY